MFLLSNPKQLLAVVGAMIGKSLPWLDRSPINNSSQDAFAILLAAHSPRLRLLGISTVHGNASLDNTTSNTLRILEAIGRRDVPVYPGASKPFCRETVHAESIHGRQMIPIMPRYLV